jgi:hypothetical protein
MHVLDKFELMFNEASLFRHIPSSCSSTSPKDINFEPASPILLTSTKRDIVTVLPNLGIYLTRPLISIFRLEVS